MLFHILIDTLENNILFCDRSINTTRMQSILNILLIITKEF